jgi:hypothetical protein
MSTICIPIPDLQKHKTVDLEITIDGVRRMMNYRVESFPWPAVLGPEDRIDLLKSYLEHHSSDWELVQIGPPDGEVVPITFRRHVDAHDPPRPSDGIIHLPGQPGAGP